MAIGSWFATEYDEPAAVLDLPAQITSGRGTGICILDQVVRGTAIVGRVTGDFGAVALKVRGTGEPMHVSVLVHLDEMATRWWSDRVKPPITAPELPRLVLLRAQGAVRGAALLARRQGWRRAGSAKVWVDFDLTADELDLDGLLVVELAEPQLPAWAQSRLSVRAAVGVRIDKISVRRIGSPNPDPAITGGTGCDMAVLQPDDAQSFRLAASAVAPAPPLPRSPSNKWTKRRPARAGFKVVRAARRAALRAAAEALPARPHGALEVQGANLLTGAPVGVEVVKRRTNELDLRLTEPTNAPILIGLDGSNPGLSLRIAPAGGR